MPYKHKIPIYTENLNLTGAYFRHQRIIDGLSLTYVADSIRMNKGFLSDLENGKRNFPNGTIQQLCNFYDISFDENQQMYDKACDILNEAFKALFFANQTEESDILKKAVENTNIYENSSAYFVFKIIELHYHMRISNNNTQIEYIRELVESNLDALSLANISIFYCLLGIYYKRKSVSIFIAENYLNKSLELSSSNSKVYAYSLFQLISLCARTNRVALAYSYCEKARNIFNRLNNYTTLFYIDFSQCNCLISMGLYDFATAKLKELLSDINQSNKEHVPKIHHSLAWCYLLNCQYSECIKYTNLAIENKDLSYDLCYFIPYSYYKQNEYLKCLDYIESHLEYADDFYKPFLQAISARIQKQNVDFEKNIILYYQSLLQNNVYEDIPLIQNFILDYYTETNNKDMMIKILIDIKLFNDKDLTLKSSTLFTTSQS